MTHTQSSHLTTIKRAFIKKQRKQGARTFPKCTLNYHEKVSNETQEQK